MSQQRPLRSPEKRMRFHIASTGPRTESSMFIFTQKFTDQGFAQRRDLAVVRMVWKRGFVTEDVGEGGVAVFTFERGGAVLLLVAGKNWGEYEHFVD